MNPAWKDVTSYSQNGKERIPKSFEIAARGVRVSITCGHIYYPGKWVMHCSDLRIDTFELKASDLQAAKAEALKTAKLRAWDIAETLSKLEV